MKLNLEYLSSYFFVSVFASVCVVFASGAEEPSSISCYSCNSAFDPRCADPFDPYSIGIVNCSLRPRLEHLPELEPVICRKTYMKIQGKERVLRGCGYIEGDAMYNTTCVRRTGTSEVEVIYCSCRGSLCNSAVSIMQSPLTPLLVSITSLLAIARLAQL
ncbi:unnamed protein product [Bemisia tabaci]|uniref:Protein sleepless n=1 Tax=Bemisia tabaci TaxID=7038 RepID=A0A9P0CBC9_BEMTA|nr:unnamed protein product [Bemisia tabaci]